MRAGTDGDFEVEFIFPWLRNILINDLEVRRQDGYLRGVIFPWLRNALSPFFFSLSRLRNILINHLEMKRQDGYLCGVNFFLVS